MSYRISLTDGTPLLILEPGIVNSDKISISLISKNASSFGDAQNENFVHMLEHFANDVQPNNELLKGQIWYNSADGVARPAVYDGVNWRPLAVLLSHSTTTNTVINGAGKDFVASMPGDLWFDSSNRQLHVVVAGTTANATETLLIGPETVKDFGTTKMSSAKMLDTLGNGHAVIQTIVNGEVLSIQSVDAFTQTTTNPVPGFTKIYRGITFKNFSTSTKTVSSSSDVALYGILDHLDLSFTRNTNAEHLVSNWTVDSGYKLQFGTSAQSSIAWSTASSELLLTTTSSVKLQTALAALTFNGSALLPSTTTVDLGTIGNKYNTLYVNDIKTAVIDSPTVIANTVTTTLIQSTTVNATNINGNAIYDTGARVLTTATIGDYGVSFITGTPNEVIVTQSIGSVTLGLPDIVDIKTLRGGNAGSAGTISGTWTLDTGSSLQATYADLAECYKADAEYAPGTVLEFGGEFEVTVAEDSTRRVAGVVSTNPAYLMNRQLMGANVAVIALTGRVPCKVRGKIQKGDMMVAAGGGYARAEFNPIMGSVIGKALEDFEGTDGVIEVVVGRL